MTRYLCFAICLALAACAGTTTNPSKTALPADSKAPGSPFQIRSIHLGMTLPPGFQTTMLPTTENGVEVIGGTMLKIEKLDFPADTSRARNWKSQAAWPPISSCAIT